MDYTREHAHLRARTDEGGAVLRVRDAAMRAVHAFFEVRPPLPPSSLSRR